MSDAITRAIDALISDVEERDQYWHLSVREEATKAEVAAAQQRFMDQRAALLALIDPERVARLEAEVVGWAHATFPTSNPESLWLHMNSEMDELDDAILASDASNIREEIGDLGLMLIHLSSMFGTTLERCMADKFATASKRAYAYDPDLGYARHVDAQRAPDAAP